MSQATSAPKTTMERLLDTVERVGNKVPHPVRSFKRSRDPQFADKLVDIAGL